MSRRVTNFDYEIFSQASGFQSVRASTLPGRTLPPGDMFSTWPRTPNGFFTTPRRLHHHHHHHHLDAHTGTETVHHNPFADFFTPPTIPARTEIDKENRRVLVLQSDVFKDAKPSVQVKDGKLHVHAARVRTSNKGNVSAREDNEFEYHTTLPRNIDLKKLSAKREGDILRITLPTK